MSEQVKDILEQGAALLKAAGAREVYVFGSVADGRAREGSDIDLAVAGLPPAIFFATMARLADLFDRAVDLTWTRSAPSLPICEARGSCSVWPELKEQIGVEEAQLQHLLELHREETFTVLRGEIATFTTRMEGFHQG